MQSLMRLGLLAVLLLSPLTAKAQSAIATDNHSRSITTGNTFQLVQGINQARRSLTIENNNASDNCYVNVDGKVAAGNTTATNVTIDGNTVTSAAASMLLLPGGAYTRYTPYLPNGPIVVTCATPGDSVYVDMQ